MYGIAMLVKLLWRRLRPARWCALVEPVDEQRSPICGAATVCARLFVCWSHIILSFRSVPNGRFDLVASMVIWSPFP
jgi:hypothetical protein